MTVTDITYRFSTLSRTMERTLVADIRLTGEDLVITETVRSTMETEVRRYGLSRETADEFLALIERFNVTSWAGKAPSSPKTADAGSTCTVSFLTLRSDDGSSADITFRETDETTGNEAAEAFRKLYFSTVRNADKISEETIYPDLKECRSITEHHGPVTAVETDSFSSGMMMGSNTSYTQTVEKIGGKDGTVRVTVRMTRGNGPEVSCSKETESDIFARVQEISDRENLPAWHYVCTDPSIPVDTSMIPLDYTSRSCLNIYYDDSLITGFPLAKRTIGEKARKMGGEKVDNEITQMINECVKRSGAKDELPEAASSPAANTHEPVIPVNAFTGFGMIGIQGWDCVCGAKGNTGKFCSNCGIKRP